MDCDFKPWLLEVNTLPSLESPSPLDKKIKFMLMADMFTIVGMPASDENKGQRKTCRVSEIYKSLGKNYKRKFVPQIEECKKLKTLEH